MLFRSYAASNQTGVSNATWTKVNLGTEALDSNSNFASSRFTPTVAGWYMFNAMVYCASSTNMSNCRASFYQNGSYTISIANKEGVFENKCFDCGISEWNNKQLVMHLDHIDGDSSNHKKDNLRMLCPNCHSQTETYKAKNRGNGRHVRRERYSLGKSF